MKKLIVATILKTVLNNSMAMEQDINSLMEMNFAFLKSKALQMTAELEIADALNDNAMNLDALMLSLKLRNIIIFDKQKLQDLLSIMISYGIFECKDGVHYGHTSKSLLLKQDHPFSFKDVLKKENEPMRWYAYNFGSQVLTSKNMSSFELATGGMKFYEYNKKNPKADERFQKGMNQFSLIENKMIVEKINFSQQNIIDIGGGVGNLVHQILEKFAQKNSTADLFDLPETTRNHMLSPWINLQKSNIISGNFFAINDSLDEGKKYDTIILKRVLHNWNDKECIEILTNAKKLAKSGTRFLIIDGVLDSGNTPSLLKDAMLIGILLGGRERKLENFIHLLDSVQIKFNQLIPIDTKISVIEGFLL